MESTTRIDEQEALALLNNSEGFVTTSKSVVRVRILTTTSYMYITNGRNSFIEYTDCM